MTTKKTSNNESNCFCCCYRYGEKNYNCNRKSSNDWDLPLALWGYRVCR
jgi:hypothetical protein